MVALPFSQVAAIRVSAALVQSLWASAKRPRLVQVAFGAAALVLSNSLAYEFAHLLPTGSGSESPGVCVILAGSVFPAQLRSRRNRCWLGRRPAAQTSLRALL